MSRILKEGYKYSMVAVKSLASLIFLVLVLLATIGFIIRHRWTAIVKFFQQWSDHDRQIEREKKLEQERRKAAEMEVETYFQSPDDIEEEQISINQGSNSRKEQ